MKLVPLADKSLIFVFGSNLKGIHGAGAALEAKKVWGAVQFRPSGLYGQSYAIPTCSKPGVPLPSEEIKEYVDKFIEYAFSNRDKLDFLVTRVGCGHAGFPDSIMAPMFSGCPQNCCLPVEWGPWDALRDTRIYHKEGNVGGYKW